MAKLKAESIAASCNHGITQSLHSILRNQVLFRSTTTSLNSKCEQLEDDNQQKERANSHTNKERNLKL